MIHCCVWGGCRAADIITAHSTAAVPFLSRILLFSFEVRKLRCEIWECARCGTGCVTFFGGRNKTLHSSSCYVPATHCEMCIFSFLIFCAAFLPHIYINSFAFETDSHCTFPPLVFSIITIPPYLIFSPLQPTISFHVWVGWVHSFPASLYLPFLLSSLRLPPSVPKEQL